MKQTFITQFFAPLKTVSVGTQTENALSEMLYTSGWHTKWQGLWQHLESGAWVNRHPPVCSFFYLFFLLFEFSLIYFISFTGVYVNA